MAEIWYYIYKQRMGTSHSKHTQYWREKEKIHGKSMSSGSRKAHTMFNSPILHSSNARVSISTAEQNGKARTMPNNDYYNSWQAEADGHNPNNRVSTNYVGGHGRNFGRTHSQGKLPYRHKNNNLYSSELQIQNQTNNSNQLQQIRMRNGLAADGVNGNQMENKRGAQSSQYTIHVSAPAEARQQAEDQGYWSRDQTKRQPVTQSYRKEGNAYMDTRAGVNKYSRTGQRNRKPVPAEAYRNAQQYGITIIERVKSVNYPPQSSYYQNPYSNEHGSIY